MQRIAVISNALKDKGLLTAIRVAEFLSGRAEVYMCDDYKLICDAKINYMPFEKLFENVDKVVVIGGDGTLLTVASSCAKNKIPVLGINLGTVGFLTEVEISDIEAALMKVINGEYTTEKRMLLKVRVNDEDTSYHALNDVVISKHDDIKIINIDLYTAGEHFNHYRADGLIIATPTGSTGYSISAGGPVVDPNMQLYIATPICAHMLSARSTILSPDKELVLRLDKDSPGGATITTDGLLQRYISANDKVVISKSEYEFELIKLGKGSFYSILMDKLS